VSVTTLQSQVAARDQQIAQCQEKINELSREHKVAYMRNSLREKVKQFEKLVVEMTVSLYELLYL